MTTTMSRSEARYGDVQKINTDEKPRSSRRQRRLRSIDQTATNQVAAEDTTNGVNGVNSGVNGVNGVKSESTNGHSVPDGKNEISSPGSEETAPYRRKSSQGRVSVRNRRQSANEVRTPSPPETVSTNDVKSSSPPETVSANEVKSPSPPETVSTNKVRSSSPPETIHENMNGAMTNEKRSSFTKANTVATSNETENRRESFAKTRSGSSSIDGTPRKLSQIRSSSTSFTSPRRTSRQDSTSGEEAYVQKSAAKLKSAWEQRALSVSEEGGKSPGRVVAIGGTTGASSLKARFESPNPTYTRKISRTRTMSKTDADSKHVSTSSLKARFEEKADAQDAPPAGKRNFVINKGQAGEAAKKFNQPPSSSTKCLVCNKNVYPMEKLEVEGLLYHKLCFKCETCKRTVGLGNYAALEGKIYCKPHLKQLFALKGNYDEGFGREQRKTDWAQKGGSAPSPAAAKQQPQSAEPEVEESGRRNSSPEPEPEREMNGNASEEETEAVDIPYQSESPEPEREMSDEDDINRNHYEYEEERAYGNSEPEEDPEM